MRLTVTVNLLGMRLFQVRRETMELAIEGQPTLAQVIALIDEQNPGFRHAVLDVSGGLSKRISVLINGDNAHYRGGVEALLNPEDVINVIPAVAGG